MFMDNLLNHIKFCKHMEKILANTLKYGALLFLQDLASPPVPPGVGNTVRVGKVVGTTRKVPTIVSSTRVVMMAMVKMVKIRKGI